MLVQEKRIKDKGLEGIPHCEAGKHVPERASWRTFKPNIDRKKCIRCLLCWLYCPDSAYTIDKKGYPVCDERVCKGCLICKEVCPVKAISAIREIRK